MTVGNGIRRGVVAALVALAPAPWATAQDVIVDNGGAGYAESGAGWFSSSNAGFYGSNSRANLCDGGPDKARWTPTLPKAGQYRVSAWWVAAGNRSQTARYTIGSLDGAQAVDVSQRAAGSTWNILGTYNFEAGTTGYVELSDVGTVGVDYVSADAVRFEFVGDLPNNLCSLPVSTLTTLSSSQGCNRCVNFLLPGAIEPHPTTRYSIHSDLPERFLSPGVLYSTQPVLPAALTNPIPLNLRTQVNNSFISVDDDFEIFVFHISSPGDGSTPRRVVTYVRNDGAGSVRLTPRQILITDGIIGNVHQMESTLGSRFLGEQWDTRVAPFDLAPGAGEVVAYSKRFSDSANTTDRSANVNCFGMVEVDVQNDTAATNPTRLTVFIVGIPGAPVSENKTRTEALLGQAAENGETALNLNTAPTGCDLRRATGVFRTFVWRSQLISIDSNALPASGNTFQMALPAIQSQGCTPARQTGDLILHPGFCRGDTIGNYMIEKRVQLRLVNRGNDWAAFDIQFGAPAWDVGLAWQVEDGATLPADAAVDARPVRTGWAGPNQAAAYRSILTEDGGPITLGPCTERIVSARLMVLGNASLPFELKVVPATPSLPTGWIAGEAP